MDIMTFVNKIEYLIVNKGFAGDGKFINNHRNFELFHSIRCLMIKSFFILLIEQEAKIQFPLFL